MYGKIFASLWNGSLVGRSAPQLVLVYLVSNCDPDGNADFHPRLIASQTGLPESEVRTALTELEAPDPESRSEADGGARIVRIDEHRDWGWHIVNYKHYRSLQDNDEVRSQTRVRVERHRKKKRPVTVGNGQKRQEEGEGEGEGEGEKEETTPLAPKGAGRAAEDFETAWKSYPHFERRSSKAEARKRWLKQRPALPTVLAAIEAAKATRDWTCEGGSRVPAMEVWISKSGWDSSEGTTTQATGAAAAAVFQRQMREEGRA